MSADFQPYVGPRPYEQDDQDRFFGRDHEAHKLLSLIISSRELLFYAQSGSGKTSLLNAGVIPLLEQKPFEVLPVARVQGVLPPGLEASKIQNVYIFNALMQWLEDGANSGKLTHTSLVEFLKQRKRPTDRYGKPYPRAIIFDQFEELFALYSDRWQDRRGFFEQVCEALEDDRRLRVVFTMREEAIAQLDPFASLMPEKMGTRFRLERLRQGAALEAIEKPLRSTKCFFAPGVAEKLVEDLQKTKVETMTGETIEIIGEFVEPVQLQVVCQNMWQELPPDVIEITEQQLLDFADVDRQLSRFYEEAVKAAATQAEIDEKKLRQWCEKWLITSTGTRNIVHRGIVSTEGIPNRALDVLVDKHLINLEWRAGAHWYELTHDRFIEPIQASNASAMIIDIIETLKEAYEAVRLGHVKDPHTIRDIAALFEAHANDSDIDVDAMKAAQILYHRAWLYEQKNKEQGRTGVTGNDVLQADRKESVQANDNIFSGG